MGEVECSLASLDEFEESLFIVAGLESEIRISISSCSHCLCEYQKLTGEDYSFKSTSAKLPQSAGFKD
jgi:hypothetical protein